MTLKLSSKRNQHSGMKDQDEYEDIEEERKRILETVEKF